MVSVNMDFDAEYLRAAKNVNQIRAKDYIYENDKNPIETY